MKPGIGSGNGQGIKRIAGGIREDSARFSSSRVAAPRTSVRNFGAGAAAIHRSSLQQNDFLNPNSCLFVAGGPAVIPSVTVAVETARKKGAFVVWVVREHHESGRDVEYMRKHLYDGTSVPAMRGSDGASLADGLVPKPGEHKIVKSRFSAFFATNLDLVLRREGIEHIIIAGVQTPNCIRATAFDAVAHDYPSLTVISDASGAQNEAIHSANLLDLRNVAVATPTLAEWAASF